MWAATSDAGRHAVAEATFERVDVLGVTDYILTLTAHAKAHGWDLAFGAGAVSSSISQSGRGERVSAETKYQPLLIPVTNVPSRVGRIAGTA